MIEKLFEGAIWRSRFITVLAVVFALLGAVMLFVVGSVDIFGVIAYVIDTYASGAHPKHFHEDIVAKTIGAIDLYLIAIVLLIFSFGVYELFISHMDDAKDDPEASKILKVSSLDQLKDKIAKVIIMVLVVNFFQRVLHTKFSTPLELLYFALSIAALALGLYFLNFLGKPKTDTKQKEEN